MGYRKQISVGVALSIALVIGLSTASRFFSDRYVEEIIEPIGMLVLFLLLSLLPLFFLKESVYLAWRKFAMWALPAVLLLILFAPARAPGGAISLGFDREVASMTFSVLFLASSWLLILVKAIKSWQKIA